MMSKARVKSLNAKYQKLFLRIKDKRSRKVVFLSHCILNENTRFLGGACRPGCVSEIVTQCVEKNIGIVQIPCPEQKAWGGVIKRLLLMAYGAKGTFLYTCRYIAIPLILLYTKWIYGWMARQTAHQIKDYLDSGFSLHGVVGIDGSPTCGVSQTLDFKKSFELLAHININTVTNVDANKVVHECLINGKGLFIKALQTKLKREKIDIRFWGHNLVAELSDKSSNVLL